MNMTNHKIFAHVKGNNEVYVFEYYTVLRSWCFVEHEKTNGVEINAHGVMFMTFICAKKKQFQQRRLRPVCDAIHVAQ
jgi:hypothetical protein